MFNNENTPILTITSEQLPNWDSHAKSLTAELRYHYSIDGTDYGWRLVDGATRQEFLKKVFEISDKLASLGYEKYEVKNKIRHLGELLYDLMLPEKLCDYLSNPNHTVLIIRTTDHDLPWEVLHDKDGFLCHRISIGRDLPRKNNPDSSSRKGINVCLIGNPTGNLPGATEEIVELRKKFSEVLSRLQKSYGIETELKVLEKEEASKAHVLFDTLVSKDKQWDIIHFAGHAKFNSTRPESSGLLLADSELKAFEVEKLNGAPILFVNACHSGLAINQDAMTGYGLFKGIATSFVKGGALGYIGSLWAIEDRTAQLMSEQFYVSVLDGAGMGEALLEAKKIALRNTDDPASIGYMLYGNPSAKLSVFEPTFAHGPFVNEQGFERIVQLEKEYSALEILLANDLPWILWRPEDFVNWVSRIPAAESRRNRMQKILYEYQRHFRKLISDGDKTFIGIINLKILRKYLQEKNPDVKTELVSDIKQFCQYPNFTLLCYDGVEEEIEEIEIVSKNRDAYKNLNESVYVFNKQVRFEQRPPSYSVHLNYDTSLIKEYTDRFYHYYETCVAQYAKLTNTKWDISFKEIPNSSLNQITVMLVEKEISNGK